MRALGMAVGALLMSVGSSARATPAHVYKVRAMGCKTPGTRVSSGFRIEGTAGIITALHGVVGCSRVVAWNDVTRASIVDLELVGVDVALDAALLRPPEELSSKGFASRRYETGQWGILYAFGYPHNVRAAQKTKVETRERAPVVLRDTLDATYERAFVRRGSPDVQRKFLALQGPLENGHSGAPLIDPGGFVVGMVTGGLGKAIAFGAPIDGIDWKDVDSERASLARLARKDPSRLFSFSPGNTEVAGVRFSVGFGGRIAGFSGDTLVESDVPDVRGFEVGGAFLFPSDAGDRGGWWRPMWLVSIRGGAEWRQRQKVVRQFPGTQPELADVGQRYRSMWLSGGYGLRFEGVTRLGLVEPGWMGMLVVGAGVHYADLRDDGTGDNTWRVELLPLVASASIGYGGFDVWRIRAAGITAVASAADWGLIGDLEVDDFHFDFAGNPGEEARVQHEPDQRIWVNAFVELDL